MPQAWWDESPREFADGFQEFPAEQVQLVEKRRLDEHSEAWLLDNGRVVIQSDVAGIETVLGPARAHALLELLSAYQALLLEQAHPQQREQKSEGKS